jgi:uracil-DNA glycosylase
VPIPEYISARISRAMPADACVVFESTPVVSFGDPMKARVATLGLNPSRREFTPVARLARDGCTADEVLEGCNTYFIRNPNKRWFGRFEPILTAFDASYENGSACHLDLVQWATNPTWKRLGAPIRKALIEADAPFLESQLRANENITLLLVNGSAVWRQLCKGLGVEKSQNTRWHYWALVSADTAKLWLFVRSP